MGKKCIIEIENDRNIIETFDGKCTLAVSARLGNTEVFIDTNIPVVPYTEPDLDAIKQEEYEKGYKTAKVQCDIQTEKDLREVGERHYQKGYRRALADVREEHVCQTCVYFERDENEEPCVRCPRNFIDQYMPKQERDAEIRVGDEVEGDEDGQRGVVIDSRFENSQVAVLTGNSKVYSWWSKCAIHKTGRHFPEIAEVLQKMKEANNG